MKNSSKIKYRIDLASLNGNEAKCNLNCEYCHKDFFTIPFDISGAKAFHFVDTIRILEDIFAYDSRPRKIHFSGRAEPLLVSHNKFSEEMDLINSAFPHIPKSLTTNGFLLEGYAPLLAEKNINKLNVSVHYNSFKSRKYLAGIKAALKYNIKVSLNAIVTFENISNIESIISFAEEQKVNVKFFSILGLSNDDNNLLFSKTLKIISEITSYSPMYSQEDNRYSYTLNENTKIFLNSPEKENLRPAACRKCPLFSSCNEGCWDSVRITPYYIKPCGVRNDNIIILPEKDINNIVTKLASAGKGPILKNAVA